MTLAPIDFRLHDAPCRITAGGRAAHPVNLAYRDSAPSAMARIRARMQTGQDWREAVREEFSRNNPWLCDIVIHPRRTGFLDLHRPAPGALVLDVGAGWGQTTLPLARSNPVVALEPTPERLDFIAAASAQEGIRDRIYFLEASMLEVEFDRQFDYIACIGVLEWVPKFEARGDPRALQVDFLRRLRRSLRPGGRCCLGIENRLGLKYLLGARDDHTAQPDISVYDAALAARRHFARTGEPLRVFTYSLAEYEALFHEAGFGSIETHAAFPDYKLPEVLLPLAPPDGVNRYILDHDLPAEHDGADGSPLPNQAELRSHYRSLAEMGIAHPFSPSFFFLLS